jgi:riboflavin kinase/FMN adenylyltransferase
VVLNDRAQPRIVPITRCCELLLASGAHECRVIEVSSTRPSDATAVGVARLIRDEVQPSAVLLACPPATRRHLKWPMLRPALHRAGLVVLDIERSFVGSQVVTGEQVRRAIASGSVVDANLMLGRPVEISGIVELGDQRGRTIGFPTANVRPDAEYMTPGGGVYAGHAWIGGCSYKAAINVGNRPTIYGDVGAHLIEAHLLDFSGDIYGATIRLTFAARIREERRFESVGDLVEQLRRDLECVESTFDFL